MERLRYAIAILLIRMAIIAVPEPDISGRWRLAAALSCLRWIYRGGWRVRFSEVRND